MQTRYPTSYPAEREAREAAAAAEQRERDRLNAEARRQYLAELDAERAAKRAEYEAAIDAELAPRKLQEQRRWLAEHPGETVADFERQAGPHLRALWVEKGRQAALEATMQQMRRSGLYSL